MRPALARFLRPPAIVRADAATVDREIARAGKNRTRHQAVEAADRMAEMRRIRIADILRQMRKVDVLVGKMQQMPGALPGAERTERDSSLLLEQMQEARWRQAGFRRAACRRHRFAGEFSDLHDRPRHARIELPLRQSLAKTHDVEFRTGDIAAALALAQFGIGRADAVDEVLALRPRQALDEVLEHTGQNALRFDHETNRRAIIDGDGVRHIWQRGGEFAIGFAAIGRRQPQPVLDRDIDVKRAWTALPRAAEQACVKHAFRRDQHQMAGFVAFVVHGWSSSRGSLAAAMAPTIADIWGLTTAESDGV